METLTQKQKHDIIIRMARRHQSDVCDAIFLLNVLYITLTPLGNTADQLGFNFASMFYIDGELVTVGTTKGKSYLNSHLAITVNSLLTDTPNSGHYQIIITDVPSCPRH